MNLEDVTLSEIRWEQKDRRYMILLRRATWMPGGRRQNGGCQGKGGSQGLFNGHRVSVSEDGKVREMDGSEGEGCAAMGMCLMPLNCPLEMVNCIVRVFYHNKKKGCSPIETPI